MYMSCVLTDVDGMSNVVLLSDDQLDVDEARRTVMCPAAGAVSMFIGLLLCVFSHSSLWELISLFLRLDFWNYFLVHFGFDFDILAFSFWCRVFY